MLAGTHICVFIHSLNVIEREVTVQKLEGGKLIAKTQEFTSLFNLTKYLVICPKF